MSSLTVVPQEKEIDKNTAKNPKLKVHHDIGGSKNDPVTHPSHYQNIIIQNQKYESIQIIDGILDSLQIPPSQCLCFGRIVKYILRGPFKNQSDKDLQKTINYFQLLFDNHEPKDSQTTEKTIDNTVVHPNHYQAIKINDQPIEVIHIVDGILDSLDLGSAASYHIGSALVYLLRCKFKGCYWQDLHKAQFYLKMLAAYNEHRLGQ